MKRVLLAVALSFSAAVFLYQYLLRDGAFIVACVLCALLLAAAVIFHKRLGARPLLCLAGAMAGLLWSAGYELIFYQPVAALDQSEHYVMATAEGYGKKSAYGVYVDAEVTELDGEPVARPFRAIFYLDGPVLEPGDVFCVTVRFTLPEDNGDFSSLTYGRARSVYLSASQTGVVTMRDYATGPIRYFPARVAHSVKTTLLEVFDQSTQGLAVALVTGDSSYISDAQQENLNRTGIAHIISVSGMHVSILVATVMLLVRSKRAALLVSMPLMLVFVLITGSSPSALRAAIMQMMALGAIWFERENDAPTSLALALAILLMFNPFSAGDLRLQLSFASVAGLITIPTRVMTAVTKRLGSGRLGKPYFRLPLTALTGAAVNSVAAMAATLPLLMLHYGSVSIVSPITNMLVALPLPGAFLFSLLAAPLGLIWLPLGQIAAAPAHWCLLCIDAVAKWIGGMWFATVDTGSGIILTAMVFILVMVALYLATRRLERRVAFGLAGALLCLALAVGLEVAFQRDAARLTVLNVGQGQCIVYTEGDYVCVVDCGGSRAESAGDTAADFIRRRGGDRVDLLILTHFDRDHVNGVLRLMESLVVTQLVIPDYTEDRAAYNEIIEGARSRGTFITSVAQSALYRAGEADIHLYKSDYQDSSNDNGLAVIISREGYEAFIMGDMNTAAELYFLYRMVLPSTAAEILVVGHHGSSGSTSERLVEALRPQAAVISVGANNYGHPTNQVLDILEDYSVTVYRTDKSGTVSFRFE